jgi:quinol monooxygenase YgiN
MSKPIISLDTSEIRQGKLDELKKAVSELVEFVRSNEPRRIAYEVYFDQTGSRMTVVQVHPDSASMEYHMTVAGPTFRGSPSITLSTLDVYGEPSEELLKLLRRKVRMLGDVTVVVHELHAGFTRV